MDEVELAKKDVKEAREALALAHARLGRAIRADTMAKKEPASTEPELFCTRCFRSMSTPFKSPLWNSRTGSRDYVPVSWCEDCDSSMCKAY